MKKQLIMEKALELFAKQGFESTSIQQITEHCGISKGAFYLSFKSKDELILALIDYFMQQITSDIDYAVKNSKNENLLYIFYSELFHSLQKHVNFAKLLVKEQTQSFNDELFLKMRYYDCLTDRSISHLVDRLYGKEIEPLKYDLVFTIKGFINSYLSLFLFNHIPLDLDLLSKSLVDKTNLLAKHSSIPFFSKELKQILTESLDHELSKEELIELITQEIVEIEESVEKESLILLKQELLQPSFNPVIIRGLIENIRNHPHCKWISYLLRKHYHF